MSKKRKRGSRFRRTRIQTGGQRVPGLPFQGELMVCSLCQKEQMSDPKVESGWTGVSVHGQFHYICPDHLAPPDAGRGKHMEAWLNILMKLLEVK